MLTTTTIRGNRAPVDHLEVRCIETDLLLGWISGVATAQVPPGEPLVFQDTTDVMVIEDETGVEEMGLATQVDTDQYEVIFPRHNEMGDLTKIHAVVPEYAKRTILPMPDKARYTWTAAVVEPHQAEELFDFDNFIPFGEPNELLAADEALFHAKSRPAAPMPKATPLNVCGFGKVRPGMPDLAKALAGVKLPASELGKTLNHLGKAAAQAGTEMHKAMEQAFGSTLKGS